MDYIVHLYNKEQFIEDNVLSKRSLKSLSSLLLAFSVSFSCNVTSPTRKQREDGCVGAKAST